MSNFTFLHVEWPEIYQTAQSVEGYVNSDPRTACFHARRALEEMVNWLFDHDSSFYRPYDTGLATLLNDVSFKENTPYEIGSKCHYIRKLGNLAVHSKKIIDKRQSLSAVQELYHLLYWLARTYTTGDPQTIPKEFKENLIPAPPAAIQQQTVKQLRLLDEELQEKDSKLREKEVALADYETKIAELQNQIANAKMVNQKVVVEHDYNEAQTRKYLIDILLREAGWDPDGENVPEYEVVGMPNNKNKGFVDYVLWGDDGKPLGLVEAKRASKDPKVGKQQAKLYADCLENMHGQRPVVFYTNGYETWIWDDTNYPERQVQGFYTKNELERIIQRRSTVKSFKDVATKKEIADRYYQEEAIRSVSEHLENKYRKALLVMATGTGKTRTTIALADVLMRAGWAKRILFLADRTALVRQAVNAFKQHLPETNPINLLDDKDAKESRVVVSTYQTMMGLIDETKGEEQKRFSVGHFDLIVIDEAHRSVYHKFGAIFEYFDSLLLGLTATPKDDVDINTYRLFELEDGVPVYNYHMDEAVSDEYLVPLKAMSVPVKFQREGISYDELSDEEQLEWDVLDWGEDEIPDHVSPGALNAWLFNQDTVDKVLEHLMLNGIKVKGGDRLGKTIIFAKNTNHAKFIEERFNANYPHLAGKFSRVISYKVGPYAQTLIDDFSKKESNPQIAISVDMLDTGIDVPEIVNLVFFKLIRSKTKFWQMIGRGTRLCTDLFMPGHDKEEFIVFDYCENFEFFNAHPQGYQSRPQEPLSQRLFKMRLNILEHYSQLRNKDESVAELDKNLADLLHRRVSEMPVENFMVRPKRRWVDKYIKRDAWKALSQTDLADIDVHVSGLPTSLKEEDETFLRFDSIALQLQLSHLEGLPKYEKLKDKIIDFARQLESKATIPMVKVQLPFILEVQGRLFWEGITLEMMEQIRLNMRGLIQFIDRKGREDVYTYFGDELGTMREVSPGYTVTGVNLYQYRKKVEQFIKTHQEQRVIRKIRFAMPIGEEDLQFLEDFFFKAEDIGSKEDFEKAYPNAQSLPEFIRGLVGLDRKAAKDAFSLYLDEKVFTAEQIRFVNYIIEHLTMNGTIEESLLFEQPFTDSHTEGLTGVFPKEYAGLMAIVRKLNTIWA
jgi:type I restriction enzyme, R subunit